MGFWFRELLEDGEKYYYVDLKAKKVEEFLDPAYMAREMEKATGRKYDPKRLGFWKINFNKGGETLNWLDGDVIFEYNRKTRKLTYTKRDKKDVNEMPRLMHYDSGVSLRVSQLSSLPIVFENNIPIQPIKRFSSFIEINFPKTKTLRIIFSPSCFLHLSSHIRGI